jgi:hypothetical protein
MQMMQQQMNNLNFNGQGGALASMQMQMGTLV